MIDRRSSTVLPSVWTVGLVGVVTLFAIIAVHFAAQQSVWTDEATQLSGLTLPFTDQLRWLAGRLPHLFAVPPDRMPPLSYWLGAIWSHTFGGSVLTLRLLSVSLSVASVLALFAVARLYLEHRTALICAVLLALSPNFLVEAVEIRAYAAFILFSVLLIYAYLRLLAARPVPSARELWGFAAAATLCSYTHFFGIVISAGAFLCLVVFYRPIDSPTRGRRLLRKAFWPACFYLTSLLGLTPLIRAAVKHSTGGDGGTVPATLSLGARIHDLVHLLYRLFGHQSMLGVGGLSVMALLAGITLILVGAVSGANPRCRHLLAFFLVNFALVAIAGITTSTFNAFSSSYNVWMLPVTALLAATALTHDDTYIRAVSSVCICVLIASDCYAALRLSEAGAIYGHTRSTVVKTAVDGVGANNAIVLYANDAPSIYFAMIYDYGGRLRQYLAGAGSLRAIGPPAERSPLSLGDLSAETLLVVHDQELSADALQFLIVHPNLHTEAYGALADFLHLHHAELVGNWSLISQTEYLAQSALAIAVFKGRAVEFPPGSAKGSSPTPLP